MVAWSRPLATRRLRLLSLNVNGLSFVAKRRALFSRLFELGHDIIVLQETHCDGDETADAWLRAGAGAGRPWGGRAFWSHGRRASRGVAVLFRAGFPGSDFEIEFTDSDLRGAAGAGTSADLGGRALRVGWRDTQTGERWSVLAAYAPNSDAEQRAFFAPSGPLWTALTAGTDTPNVVLAGDFNCVTEVEDSSAVAAAAQAAAPGASALREMLAHFQLRDIWQHYRARNPAADTQFTYWATNSDSARRLDRVYASPPLFFFYWQTSYTASARTRSVTVVKNERSRPPKQAVAKEQAARHTYGEKPRETHRANKGHLVPDTPDVVRGRRVSGKLCSQTKNKHASRCGP
jgi:exonuclease III